MNSIVITDTSCLILLDKLNALYLLPQLYQSVFTTPQVAQEFRKVLPDWLIVIEVKSPEQIAIHQQHVDLGEASAIALAQQIPNAMLIIDDLKGRRLAKQLNLKVTGTIGVLIAARQQKKITTLRPFFELVRQTDFRIDPKLLDRVMDDFKD